MPIPNLSDWDARLDATCRDYLGELIQYAADGVTFVGKRAHVEYADTVRAFEVASAIQQNMSVAILKADVPTKPTQAVRLILSKRAGKIYRPLEPRTDESGTHWVFDLQQVS